MTFPMDVDRVDSADTLLKFVETVLNVHDDQSIGRFCTPNLIFYNPVPLLAISRVVVKPTASTYECLQRLTLFLASSRSDIHFDISNITGANEFATFKFHIEGIIRVLGARWPLAAPNSGEEALNGPLRHSSGKLLGDRLHLEVQGNSLVRFSRGRIAECWSSWVHR